MGKKIKGNIEIPKYIGEKPTSLTKKKRRKHTGRRITKRVR